MILKPQTRELKQPQAVSAEVFVLCHSIITLVMIWLVGLAVHRCPEGCCINWSLVGAGALVLLVPSLLFLWAIQSGRMRIVSKRHLLRETSLDWLRGSWIRNYIPIWCASGYGSVAILAWRATGWSFGLHFIGVVFSVTVIGWILMYASMRFWFNYARRRDNLLRHG
jgi:hypothetical protein